MTDKRVLLDRSVIVDAIREALHARGFAVEPFPPADAKCPATSVLASAVSKELLASGCAVVTTEALVNAAFQQIEDAIEDTALDLLHNIEDRFWEALDDIIDRAPIEPDDSDQRSPLGEELAAASRALLADVVVASDNRILGASNLGSVVVCSPRQWLDVADSEVRKHRADHPS